MPIPPCPWSRTACSSSSWQTGWSKSSNLDGERALSWRQSVGSIRSASATYSCVGCVIGSRARSRSPLAAATTTSSGTMNGTARRSNEANCSARFPSTSSAMSRGEVSTRADRNVENSCACKWDTRPCGEENAGRRGVVEWGGEQVANALYDSQPHDNARRRSEAHLRYFWLAFLKKSLQRERSEWHGLCRLEQELDCKPVGHIADQGAGDRQSPPAITHASKSNGVCTKKAHPAVAIQEKREEMGLGMQLGGSCTGGSR